MSAISVLNLSFGYREKPVLQNLSVEVRKGDFCAILGPNGSGKTTLLKNFAGLLKPQGGEVLVNGRPIDSYPIRERALNMAYVPQHQDLVFEITVFDYVMMGRNPYQTPWSMQNPEDEAVVEDVLKKCNVLKYRDALMQELSGGERQRVTVARALAQQTGILLLDEPLSNIDITHKFEIMEILRDENRSNNVTVLIVLHDLPIAHQYAKQVLLMKDGGMMAYGDKNAVLSEDNIRKSFGLNDDYQIYENGFIAKNDV